MQNLFETLNLTMHKKILTMQHKEIFEVINFTETCNSANIVIPIGWE